MSEWMIKVTHMKVSVEMKAKEVGHSKNSVHSHNAIIQRKKQETNLHCLGQMLDFHIGLLGTSFGIVSIAMSLADLIWEGHAFISLAGADACTHILVFNAEILRLPFGGRRLLFHLCYYSRIVSDFIRLSGDRGCSFLDEGLGRIEVLLCAYYSLFTILPSRRRFNKCLGLLLLGCLR